MVGIKLRSLMQASKITDSLKKMSTEDAISIFGSKGYAEMLTRLMIAEGILLTEREGPAKMISGLTPNERLFTAGFFAKWWSGQGNILEIGPHLGSSTRLISLGAISNPDFDGTSKIYTYDKFEDYEILPEQFERMNLPSEILDDYEASNGKFLNLFNYFHGQSKYRSQLEAKVGILPDTVEALGESDELFSLPAGVDYSAVFVDGCKSWYGTKYFFKELAPHIKKGAQILFQDYGHYTCFWVPAFVLTFPEHFELIANVDNTYTFELIKEFSAQDVEDRFPDCPTQYTLEELNKLFDGLLNHASDRNDIYGLFSANLQYAAAMAYVGEIERSKHWFSKMDTELTFQPYQQMLHQAYREGPTYRPNGEMVMLN
jgi:hypothetical protein